MNRLLAVLAAFVFIPGALAGSADEPEVTDPSGDNIPGALSADIVKMWIDDAPVGDNANQLFLHVDLAAAPQHLTALYVQHTQLRVDFVAPDGQGRYISMRFGSGGIDSLVPIGPDKTLACQGGLTDGESYQGVQQAFSPQMESDTRYGCIFPLAFAGSYQPGDALTGLKVKFTQTSRGPLAGEDIITPTDIITYDDTDVGMDYVLPFEPEVVLPEFNETIDAMPFRLNQSMDMLSAAYTYTWMGTNASVHEFNGTLVLENGTTFVRVTDPDGNVHYEGTFEGPWEQELTATAFAASEGNWTVEVDHTEATGSLSFLLTPDPLPGAEPHEEDDHDDEHGDEPDDEHDEHQDESEDAPGIGFLGVIALLAVALRRK